MSFESLYIDVKKYFFIILATILIVDGGFSQILDDTTRLKYGPHTTKYYIEYDILNNDTTGRRLDTALTDLHNQFFIFSKNTTFQDLGQIGTPVATYGYISPERPGRRYGFDNFDLYQFAPSDIKYFDSQSPYSEISYIQGSRGQQLGKASFSRNINYHWNIGFDYRIFSTKKINGLFRKQPYSTGNVFDLFTRYFTPNKRYQVLANFSFFDEQLIETGGIKPDSGEVQDVYFDLFDDIREEIYLNDELSNIKKFQYHVYQQFDIIKKGKFQVYNIFDYSKKRNWFKQRGFVADSAYFTAYNIPNSAQFYPYSSYNLSYQKLLENEGGFKGQTAGFNYRVFYRYKDIDYGQHYNDSKLSFKEEFFGTDLQYALGDSSFRIRANAEKMLNGDDWKYGINIIHKYFKAGFQSLSYSPSLFEQLFVGNFIQWYPDDSLSNTIAQNVFAELAIKRKSFFVSGSLSYYQVKNLIYLDEDKYRKQASDEQMTNPLKINLNAGINISRVHLENFLEYNSVGGKNGGENLIRTPEFINTSRLYYQNNLFKNVAYFQIGIDLNYRSGYMASYYLPNYQHYYLNNDLEIEPYMYADIFLNAQIKNVLGFIKIVNVTQNLREGTSMLGPGYFITPGYTGLPRTIFFGLSWRFYN